MQFKILNLVVVVPLIINTISVSAQGIKVHGKVEGTNNQGGLVGVTVRVKGTDIGTITDQSGNYLITSPKRTDTLEFSSVGYITQNLPLKGREVLNVLLSTVSNKLNSLVVIGYGTVKESDLTGSVSQVSSKSLTAFPTDNIAQAMEGRAAGVQVLQNSGSPGSGISVRIRGTTSILGSNEPLYIIDGFPGNPDFLSSNDIASIEVLKDASATAIYGSRGANGVVIITTKKGRAGQLRVDYDASYGMQSVRKELKMMNAQQYATFYNQQIVNDGGVPYFTNQQIEEFGKTPGTNWQNVVLRDAPVTNHSITVSGGTDKTQFSVSGGAFIQDGIVRNSNYNRYTLRANINHDISQIFRLEYNVNLAHVVQNNQNPSGGNRGSALFSAMITAPPTISPYTSTGAFTRMNTVYPFISNDMINPLDYIMERSNKIITNQELANIALIIQPVRGLSIRLSAGIQNQDETGNTFSNIDSTTNSPGTASITTSNSFSLLNENIATYTKRLGDSRFSITGGFTYQDDISTNLNASGAGFLSNVVGTANLQGSSNPGIPSSGYSKWVLLSYLARINYSYKDKYLFTGSIRRDGASQFSSLNKWGNFPSVAFAWRISQENFMKNIQAISNLKLRISYGSTGNNTLTPYQTLNTLAANKTVLGNILYTNYAPGSSLPGTLKWETTNEFDVGIDGDFFDNRLSITADYYVKHTKDLLDVVQLPASTGYVNTLENVGSMENQGPEFSVSGLVIDKAVRWNLSVNMSFNRNKVLSLFGGQSIPGAVVNNGIFSDFINIVQVGEPVGVFYGYKDLGYKDNGNINYAPNKTIIGTPWPKFIYGLNSSLSFKGFNLGVFINGTQGNDIYNVNASQTIDLGFGLNEPEEEFFNHWTSTKTNAKYPAVTSTITGNVSDRFVENGSYLRVRNIELAYNLPIQSIKWINGIQVYVSGQDLITLTHYSWFDPEVNTLGGANSIDQGIDFYGYPTAKSVTFGVRCTFK